MINNIALCIQNKCIAFCSNRTLIAEFTDRAVVQIDKKDTFFFTATAPVTDSTAQCDHPWAFSTNDVLYMGRSQNRTIRLFECSSIPFLRIEIQILIYRFTSIINQHPSVLTDDTNISNITPAVQDCLELI